MSNEGKSVQVHYKGTLADGTVFDSSEGRDPLSFTVGEGKLIPGFEDAVRDMQVDETRKIEIPCADAYGEHDRERTTSVPKANLPDDLEPKVGMVLRMTTPQGAIPVKVTQVQDDSITVDANHPLAGQDLTFEITLVTVG